MPTFSTKSCWNSVRNSRQVVVFIVFIAIMLDVMMMTSIDPILPDMLKQIQNESDVSRGVLRALEPSNLSDSKSHEDLTTEVGIMVAAKPATEMFTNILVGFLVDSFGHKYPMLLGFLFNFGSLVGFAYGSTYWVLILTRMCQAVGSSLSVVGGLAFLASIFPDDEERAKATSRAFGGISLGVILGYPYGSVVYQFFGREAPFLILAALNLLDGGLRVILVSPNQLAKPPPRTRCDEFCGLLTDPYILVGLGCCFLPHFGLGVFLATGPAWMLDSLHAEQWNIGVVLAAAVIFHFTAQTLTGIFAVRFGRWKFCMAGMLLFAIGMATYPLCDMIWEVLGPEIVVRIGHGTILCVISPLLGYIADIRHNSNYGAVYGLYTASYNLGLSMGPLVGGFLMRYYPFSWIYWATAAIIALFSLTSIVFRNPKKTRQDKVLIARTDYGSISDRTVEA